MEKYDCEFPLKYFKEFLEYIDVTADEFHKIIDDHRSPHIWTKKNDKWMLRHSVGKNGTDD